MAGASGGMGTMVCQLCKHIHEASYVVGVASKASVKRLQDLGCCDEVIDYTMTDPFTHNDYIQTKFDIMIDFAGFAYQRLMDEQSVADSKGIIVKASTDGGRFVTTVPPIGPFYEVHSIYQALQIFLFPLLWLAVKSRIFPSYRSKLPVYSFASALTFNPEPIAKLFEYVSSGKVKAVVDPAGPFPFTTEGLRSAFKLQESRHAFGKVVFSTIA